MAKDQSYVLYMLGQAELARLRLPIGEMTKETVRRAGRRAGPAHGDETGQPGCLLHLQGRLEEVVFSPPASRSGTGVWSRLRATISAL